MHGLQARAPPRADGPRRQAVRGSTGRCGPQRPQRKRQVRCAAGQWAGKRAFETPIHNGFSLQRRSAWADTPPADAAAADVWLGDTMGEMPLYYAMADVALLGGSFAALGGQNLIEAAACGCPMVLGPHIFNFEDAANLAIEAGATVRMKDLR